VEVLIINSIVDLLSSKTSNYSLKYPELGGLTKSYF